MSLHINRIISKLAGGALCFLVISLASCKKFVTVGDPETALSENAAFEKEQPATSAVLDVYFSLNNLTGNPNYACMTKINALYTDEYTLTNTNPDFMALHTNSLDANNAATNGTWNEAFSAIYKLNAILVNIEKYGAAIPKASRDQLIGEARFMRAYCYFLLVNIYGPVPVLLTPDYQQNKTASRSPEAAVYAQILDDLLAAKELVRTDYLESNNAPGAKRLRANKDVVTAFLAKVYLYMGNWDKAEELSTEIINKTGTYVLETDLNRVFNTDSKEAILQFDDTGWLIPWVAHNYLLDGAPANTVTSFGIGVLSNSMLSYFEPGDKRRNVWVGTSTVNGTSYYYPHKYRSSASVTQYLVGLRLGELYLVRAEAYIQQDLVPQGIADINAIRRRARAEADVNVPDPLPDLFSSLSKRDALLALEKERLTELFIEGDRWFDLKRWKGIDNPAVSRADELMPAIATNKGGSWESYKKLFPLPESETLLNVNLEQNDGY